MFEITALGNQKKIGERRIMDRKIKVNLLGFLTVILWASAFPISKVALTYYSPNTLGALRCATAAIFLIILGKKYKIGLPKKKDIPKFFISGGMGFAIYLFAFNTGVQTLTSATSSILVATTPVMTAIAASIIYKEKIKILGWIAIAIEFVGILVLTLWDGVFSVNKGIFWTLSAALAFCVYNLYQRKLSAAGYETLQITTYSMACGSILLFFFLPQGIPLMMAASLKQIFIILYLGVFPSAIAYFLWGKALVLAEKTSDVTNFIFVTPLLAVVMGFLILREIPSMGTLLGGIIIIVGLIIFNLKGR